MQKFVIIVCKSMGIDTAEGITSVVNKGGRVYFLQMSFLVAP